MQNSTKKLIIAIISVVAGLAILIPLIIILSPKEYDAVKVTNNPDSFSKISTNHFNTFRTQLIRHLREQNLISEKGTVDDISIRENTIHVFTTTESGTDLTNSYFIIDIDSLKQTYQVEVSDSIGDYVGTIARIKCPKISEMKYPETECIGQFNDSSKKVIHHLPYTMELASGERVIVKNFDDSKVLQVYLYSCDAKNPPINATKTAVESWIKSLGDDATYELNIRTGYCIGDTI